MFKPSENPPALMPADGWLAELNGSWWVRYTRSRCEKVVAWDRHWRVISYFPPMVQRVRWSGERKRRVTLPMFPSYVFFCGDESTRYHALKINHSVRTLDVVDQERLRRELCDIEAALHTDFDFTVRSAPAAGSWCRVIAGPLTGPLKGSEGVAVRWSRKSCFVLQVSVLGKGVELETERDLLERVPEPLNAHTPARYTRISFCGV